MASQIGGDSDEPISGINVTPFVDIILVVLIIFMVTTPIIMQPSIKIQLPKAISGEQSAPTELNITISTLGEILLNGKKATEDELGKASSDMAKANPDIQAIISADKETPHGKVVGVIDTVKTAGVRKFAISIEKK